MNPIENKDPASLDLESYVPPKIESLRLGADAADALT